MVYVGPEIDKVRVEDVDVAVEEGVVDGEHLDDGLSGELVGMVLPGLFLEQRLVLRPSGRIP